MRPSVPKNSSTSVLQRLYHQEVKGLFKSSSLSLDSYIVVHHQARQSLRHIKEKVQSGLLPVLQTPFWSEDFTLLETVAKRYQRFCKQVLIFGTGGSALGAKAFCALAHPARHKEGPSSSGLKIHFCENLDPQSYWHLLSTCDPRTTGIIAISKSGKTPETLLQVMRCIEFWGANLTSEQWRQRLTFITEPGAHPLGMIAGKMGAERLAHPKDIGGRFSCFTLVGLLPALLAGLNIRKIRQGAGHVVSSVFSDGGNTPPVEGAALLWHLTKELNINQQVFMPYGDVFGPFSEWLRQLWAESLGKQGKGMTPIVAMGPVDQHSQLQLYLDGPRDKFFTLFIEKKKTPESLKHQIWNDLMPELKVWAHSRMGDLVHAQFVATSQVLAQKGRPLRVITTPQLTEMTLGALMMHFIVETLLVAALLEVDPLDQPAVEEGKVIACQLLSEHVNAFHG